MDSPKAMERGRSFLAEGSSVITERAFGTLGRVIAYHANFRQIMGTTAGAVVLSQLFYWCNKAERKIYKTDQDIMEETGVTPKELRHAKKRLKESTFCTVSLEGVPAKTFYCINNGELAKCLECTVLKGQTRLSQRDKLACPKGTISPYNKITTQTTPNACGVVCGFGIKKEKTFDSKKANQLYEIVAKNRKLIVPPNMKQWVNEFHHLRIKDGVSKSIISKSLLWYRDHIGEKYVPQAYSAKTFRCKFQNILDAMERSGVVSEEIEITEAGQKIITQLNAPEEKAAAIQRSLNIIQGFFGAAKELKQTVGRQMMLEKLGHPATIVLAWFKENEKAMTLEDLTRLGRKVAKEVTGDVSRWEKDFKEILHAG